MNGSRYIITVAVVADFRILVKVIWFCLRYIIRLFFQIYAFLWLILSRVSFIITIIFIAIITIYITTVTFIITITVIIISFIFIAVITVNFRFILFLQKKRLGFFWIFLFFTAIILVEKVTNS